MTKSRIFGFLSVLACLALAAALPAAAQVTGVQGQVIDVKGQPMNKVKVTFTRLDIPGKPYVVYTDKHGNYADTTLPQGTYKIVFSSSDGTALFTQNNFGTHPGDPLQLDVNFKAAQEAAATDQAPPGMNKEQAAAYLKKLKEAEDANQKLGKLNDFLKQNKALVDQKQYDQAVGVMEQAVAVDQTHDILYANLADDYSLDKQYDKSIEAYQKALSLNPNNAAYHINMGSVYAKEGKIDESNAEFAKAVAQDPTQGKLAFYNDAVNLYNTNKMDEASAAFDKYLALDPTNGDAWYYKGMAMLNKATSDASGKIIPIPGTVEALQKSIALAPTGPNAQTAKDALKALTGK